MKKVLVLHGPNLNQLGKREPEIYGTLTLDELNNDISNHANMLGVSVVCEQYNSESQLVDTIHAANTTYDGIVLNAAALTHTSVSLRDAIASIQLPVIEVHLSHIYRRETFRHYSAIAPVCTGQISGFGKMSYFLALQVFSNAE